MKRSVAISLLVLASLFWAGNYVFGKYIINSLKPIQINFLRWLLAGIILLPLSQILEKPSWKKVWKEWPILLVLSIFGIIGYNVLLYKALSFTSSINAALINSVNPALIAVFASLILKEGMNKINILGIFISLLGVLLVLTYGNLLKIFSISYNQGDFYMILVIVSWTIYTLLAKKISYLPPIASTSVIVFFSLIIMLPFFINSNFNWSFKAPTFYSIIYLGLFPSVGSLVFWNSAVPVIGAGKSGIFLNLITVFTVIISVILGNKVTAIQIIGGAIVILGVYLTNKKTGQLN
ncbi:DMT family transporter [Oenococcus sp. UCMA 17063]|nr:DMT family transporter [Oenococcus sp. UCMA 17063]